MEFQIVQKMTWVQPKMLYKRTKPQKDKMQQLRLMFLVIHVALVTGFQLTGAGLLQWSGLTQDLVIATGQFELVDICYHEGSSEDASDMNVYIAASQGSVVKVFLRLGGLTAWVLHSELETNVELADLKITCADDLAITTAATDGTIAWNNYISPWMTTTVGVASEPKVYLGGNGFYYFAYRTNNNSKVVVSKVVIADAVSGYYNLSWNPSFPFAFDARNQDTFLLEGNPDSEATGFYFVGSSSGHFLVPSGGTLVEGDSIDTSYPLTVYTGYDIHGGCYVNTNSRLRCVGYITSDMRNIFGMNFGDVPDSIGSTLQGYGFIYYRSTGIDIQVTSFVDQGTNKLQLVQWSSADNLSVVVAEDSSTKSASVKLQKGYLSDPLPTQQWRMLVAKVDNINGDLTFSEIEYGESSSNGFGEPLTGSISIEEIASIVGTTLFVMVLLGTIWCKVRKRGCFAETPNKALHFNINGPFDAFLSHDWVDDHHEIVGSICNKLVEQGLTPWLDEHQLNSNLALQMAQGIQNSSCFVAFITQAYLDKVNSLRQHDNCRKEFQFAIGRSKTIIPVVLEPHLLDTSEWSGLVQLELGNTIYINMSTPELIERNLTALVKRINEAPKLTREDAQPENRDSDDDDHLSIVVTDSEPDHGQLEQRNPGHSTLDELDAEE